MRPVEDLPPVIGHLQHYRSHPGAHQDVHGSRPPQEGTKTSRHKCCGKAACGIVP